MISAEEILRLIFNFINLIQFILNYPKCEDCAVVIVYYMKTGSHYHKHRQTFSIHRCSEKDGSAHTSRSIAAPKE